MLTLSNLGSDERTARVVLSTIARPNDPATGQLLNHVGAVETLRLTDTDGPVPGMDRIAASIWRDHIRAVARPDEVAARLAQAERGQFSVLVPGDADWPTSVDDLGDRAPYALWTRGDTKLLARPAADRVTLTGARASTGYGDHVTLELAGDLASSGRVIVAGGAYGIEGSAHKAALAVGGSTIAVLASGLDRLYPVGHADLLERIGNEGLLLSEAPPGTAPTRQRFLDRARIVAALSAASMIVEAGARSGSMRVAEEARRLGRGVGAVPGPVTSAASVGPHLLLQDHGAQVITNSDDVVRLLDRDRGVDHDARLSQPSPEYQLTRGTETPKRRL